MTSDAVEVLILCLEEQLGTSAEPCSSIYRAVLVSLSSTMTSLQGLEIKVLSSISATSMNACSKSLSMVIHRDDIFFQDRVPFLKSVMSTSEM